MAQQVQEYRPEDSTMTSCTHNYSDKNLTRRKFGQIMTGLGVLPAIGSGTPEPGFGEGPGDSNPKPVPLMGHATPGQLPPVFEKMGDGTLRWSVGNSLFLQQIRLDQGLFYCSSLLNRHTGREWIHPTKRSTEFLVQIGKSKEQSQILSGQEKWNYQDHFLHARERGWYELEINLRAIALPLRISRHYWWNQRLPLLRQSTRVHNDSPESLILRRADTFQLRVAPGPEPLMLHWINDFCRAMKPSPGNPIHYLSIDENVDHTVSSGPYSPDFGWFGLWIPGHQEGLIGGWEWSSPMVVHFGDLLDPCLISGGLDPQGMEEELLPGKSFIAPLGWYGFADGDLDDAAGLSHDLVRTALGPELPKKDYPWVAYDSWSASLDENNPFNEKGTHPWFPTQVNLLSQVDAVASMGCELFLWDFGWFPQIGDWWCDPKRFPEGPKPLIRAVKRSGMKLGLWMGFGNANDTSEVVRQHPDWLATYQGRPIPDRFFTRTAAEVWNTRTLCLGHRPVREWVKGQLTRIIEEFELDWLKHDFDLITICQDPHHTHTPGDGRLAACEGFYEIMEFILERYPRLLCENWMNNSAVPDYGVLQRHHMQLIGDAYNAFQLRQMVYGHSQIFPLDRQQRYIRFEDSKGDLKTLIRSGSIGGPCTLLSDPRLLSDEKRTILKGEIEFYKKFRYLLATAKPFRLSGRPHPLGWDALELYDSIRGEGIVYAFRNSHPEARKVVALRGLEGGRNYRVTHHDRQELKTLSGHQMTNPGIIVDLEHPNTSEVILFSRLPV